MPHPRSRLHLILRWKQTTMSNMEVRPFHRGHGSGEGKMARTSRVHSASLALHLSTSLGSPRKCWYEHSESTTWCRSPMPVLPLSRAYFSSTGCTSSCYFVSYSTRKLTERNSLHGHHVVCRLPRGCGTYYYYRPPIDRGAPSFSRSPRVGAGLWEPAG